MSLLRFFLWQKSTIELNSIPVPFAFGITSLGWMVGRGLKGRKKTFRERKMANQHPERRKRNTIISQTAC
jgi:hypothetical protein